MEYSYNRYLRAMGWGGRTEATWDNHESYNI